MLEKYSVGTPALSLGLLVVHCSGPHANLYCRTDNSRSLGAAHTPAQVLVHCRSCNERNSWDLDGGRQQCRSWCIIEDAAEMSQDAWREGQRTPTRPWCISVEAAAQTWTEEWLSCQTGAVDISNNGRFANLHDN